MNPIWLVRNVIECRRYRASLSDFIKRLIWVYVQKASPVEVPVLREIGIRYPSPVGDIRLVVRANDGSDKFILGEVFQHNFYDLRLPVSSETILDVGANAGFTAIYFARAYGGARLACVEPIPENLRVLRRNLELNAVSAAVYPAAVPPASE